MGLEGAGQSWGERHTASGQQGTGSGQQGTVSGQRGLGSETRGEAEDRIALQVALDESARDATLGLNDNESSQESDEDDRQSQAASLANTADGSMDLVIIMPDKIPVCFLCSLSADSPNPLLDADEVVVVGHRPWMSYNKVYRKNVLIGKKPTVCVCRICANVYKAGGSSAQYGKITEYKKLLIKKDGAQKHKDFLAALKEWMRQHKENPSRTKLKNKKSLMEV